MADNDKKGIKLVKDFAKQVLFRLTYIGKDVADEVSGNQYICNKISEGKPFAAVRFGAVEARCVSKWMRKKAYSAYNLQSVSEAAGFFPNSKEMVDLFCEVYVEAASTADILAVWGVQDERKIVDKYCNKAKLTRVLALEPYFYSIPWSSALEGKKVLIVHPFIETIKGQLEHKNELFQNKSVLPEFKKVSFVKAVLSNAGEITEYASWFEALDSMKRAIGETDFDIAIIGAGAYGLPLAAYCKQIGKQAIQMAGATQILFGIKGKRWDKRKQYCELYNQYWTRPNLSETPKGKDKVEGGTYW